MSISFFLPRPEGPQPGLSLRCDEVHVWSASLDLPSEHLAAMESSLAGEERERAARFRLPLHRARFVAARGLLRRLLGEYLDRTPEGLHFAYGERGKPVLVDEPGLEFNLSHAQDLVLYAVTRSRALGVDVERIRPEVRHERIAARFFSAREQAALASLPVGPRLRAFFECWTRKEAYLKARGGGLDLQLDRFSVSLRPGEPAALLEAEEGPQECGRWRLEALDAAPDYAAAVCVEGRQWQLRCWRRAD